mmetsp:Transcript_37516/g.98995  ORF Transcript_37516/g.98995 Transcript_37516/m.98995 type:complete len:207 (-) Transcript_37516:9-629(-)|eukprot:CAMPEP_0115446806 /NCGR_PEP_ID=MMETSP0271-20121206/39639_1 /TAXON_ID=71861 /ORGANISM="Scrippsiella trochoidea, Strain CCMP3099" /LENGTH=206 /DNA_ID=CAMNT_0002872855 /DNA_START=83 /DNA_END=703 /DNA_ORIENTATION=-
MSKARKQLRKFQTAHAKKRIAANDPRVKNPTNTVKKDKLKGEAKVRESIKAPSTMFFQYNENLRPPYQVLLDTNFLRMSIQMKLDVFKGCMDCLLAKCNPCITDCVMGELEKMGRRHRLALRLAKDERFTRLTCQHKGTYADDCIHDRVSQHKCYIVATNDKDLKRRIRKVPGIPIMSAARGGYRIERVPDTIDKVSMKSNWGADK